MSEFIKIGKIVDTHGIKGEIRILSDFELKEKVFSPGFRLYIGSELAEEIIKTYRHHKNYEMVCFENYSNINEVLKYMKKDVYIRRNDLKLEETAYVLEDLIGLDIVENDKVLGKVKDFSYNSYNTLLEVDGSSKFYIPVKGDYIKKVDLEKKIIECEKVSDLML